MVLLFIVLMALITAGLYLYPVVCVALIIPSLFLGARPRPLPDPDELVTAERRTADREVIAALSTIEQERIRLHDLAGELGLDTTSASGGTRYDNRKRDARSINQKLDDVEARLAAGTIALRESRTLILATIPDWRAHYRQWMTWRAWALAARTSLFLALITLVAMMIARSDYPEQVALVSKIGEGISSNLFWQPIRIDLLSIFMTAVMVGYLTLFVARPIFRKRLERSNAPASMLRLVEFEEEFDPGRIDYLNYHPRSETLTFEELPTESWWKVLGVSADASAEEIRNAYRQAIKGYHSDKVAHLGEKLRELAEVESRRLNGAYDTAKTERGFV